MSLFLNIVYNYIDRFFFTLPYDKIARLTLSVKFFSSTSNFIVSHEVQTRIFPSATD